MTETTTALSPDIGHATEINPARQTAVYYVAFLFLGLIMMVLGATLPEIARRTNAGFDHISYSFLFRSMGFFLGALFGGRIYDRIKRGHRVLAAAIGTMALLSATVPITPKLGILIASFLLQGLAGSLINVGGNTLLMWTHRNNVGALLSGLHFSWGLGSAILPLIVEQIEKLTGDISWAYWAVSVLAIPLCWMLLSMPSPAHPIRSDEDGMQRVILPLAIMVAVFFFFYTGFEASVINWIHTYTIETGLGSKSAAYKLNSAFLLLFTFGRLLAIPIATRLRPRTILMADFGLALLSVGVLLIWQHSVTALWVGSCGLGLAIASVFPTMLSFAQRRMHLSGKLTGYLFSASSGGSMVLPFIVGQFFAAVGPHVLFLIVIIAMTIDIVIFSTLMALYPSQIPRKQ